MKIGKIWGAVLVGIAVSAVPWATARAGDQYASSFVNDPTNTTDVTLIKPGSPPLLCGSLLSPPEKGSVQCPNKILIKPANFNPKTGAHPYLSVLLVVKNVDCPTEGNDKGKVGKCGINQDVTKCKSAGKPNPCCTGLGTGNCAPQDAALGLSVRTLGQDFTNVIGVSLELKAGTAVFKATGKNKVDGSIFGGLAGAIAGQQIGFGVLEIHTPGSDPTNPATGCDTATPNIPNTCLDGPIVAMTGLTAGQ